MKFRPPPAAPQIPLPGENPALDAFIRGDVPANEKGRAPLSLVPDGPLPGNLNLRLTREHAQLIETAFQRLPYKTRKAMIEAVLFSELKRLVGPV